MAAQGASLQNYNNQLVGCLEELKEQRDQLSQLIQKEESEKAAIQQELAILTERLTTVNRICHSESLAKKLKARNEYEQTIHETEAAYLKILESSQTLLHVLKREGMTLAKKANEA